MTIETPTEPTDEQKQKRRDSLAKARAAKAEKAKAVVKEAEDIDARRARLLRELGELPPPEAPKGVVPGTLVGETFSLDKVPWTASVIRDACDRGLTIGNHKFSWVEVIGDPSYPMITWNGIPYWFFAGEMNKIPSVHYEVYKQALADRKREAARWTPPANPGRSDGYMAAPHVMGVGPLGPDTRGE
jgi:hypothetical protein